MLTRCQFEIKQLDGFRLEHGICDEELDDPIFLNLQFCIEREQYNKLHAICKEYKTSIRDAIVDILNDDPEKLIEQYF